MFSSTHSSWMFCALALTTSTAFAEAPGRAARQTGPTVAELEPLQAPPQLPQFVLDACRNRTEGEACSVEFQGQKLSGSCRKIPDHEQLACLPAGPPPNHRGD
jgi:hypothetical protein